MEYLVQRPDLVLDVVIEHVYITIVATLGATILGVLLGILITRVRVFYEPVLTLAGIIYTVPSLAMFVLMIPVLGIGFRSAVIALVLYSLLIIIRNTAVGLDSVDPNILEAARGMGMTQLSILFRIELPLALPIIFAGIRIATVSAISLATIASFIGAGGIGDLIFQGISSQREDKIVAGAVTASLLAIGAQVLLQQVENGASPGITGEFKTVGEHVADFFAFLRDRPDVVVLAGALLVLLGYFAIAWVRPYANDPAIANSADVIATLDEAGYPLDMSGYTLARLQGDVPVKRSLEILPWLAAITALFAVSNLFFTPASRASAEVLLLAGILVFFPLFHFYLETQRAVGDLGTFSELFRMVRNDLSSIAGVRVSPRLDTLPLLGGYTITLIGGVLMLAGAFLKSLWFRRNRQLEEARA